jgi:hypothetical protein
LLTASPEIELAVPAWYSSAPTTSRRNAAPGELMAGLSVRSIEALNVSAVMRSFDGGEKRKVFRTLNVYVRPSAEMSGALAATSGSGTWSAFHGPSG